MKYYVDFGRKRDSINFVDNIIYSKVKDLEGKPLELDLSIMSQSGNSEMKAAAGYDDQEKTSPKPLIVWVSGGGYRGVDKNQMIAETQYLADAGYIVASVYYRSSAQGHFPAQIIDVKTAIRYLRAHAEDYNIDIDNIGIMGRSAGGHLTAFAAMNMDGYDSDEWSGYSSEVQAGFNLFGPTNLVSLLHKDIEEIKDNPNHRWKKIEESHLGALLGGDSSEFEEKSRRVSVVHLLNERIKMAPLLIMHGDSDPLIPDYISEELYDKLVKFGFGSQTEYYLIKNAGHGTPEFFQEEARVIALNFFNKYLGIKRNIDWKIGQ
jgi:pimeloyl-ACP methyl ester carboxylesterase